MPSTACNQSNHDQIAALTTATDLRPAIQALCLLSCGGSVICGRLRMRRQEYFRYLRSIILATSLALPPIHGSAESLTNNNGVVYENVTVISATPKHLLIDRKSTRLNS